MSTRKLSIVAPMPGGDDKKHLPGLEGHRPSLAGHRKSVAGQVIALQAATKWRRRLSKRPPSTSSSSMRRHAKPQVENTYRLAPGQEQAVQAHEAAIRTAVGRALEQHLDELTYNSQTAGHLAVSLGDQIKERVKDLDIPRYKFVCSVFIAENKDQGVHSVSRCLWNHATDSYITVNYSNATIHATAMVHVVYFE